MDPYIAGECQPHREIRNGKCGKTVGNTDLRSDPDPVCRTFSEPRDNFLLRSNGSKFNHKLILAASMDVLLGYCGFDHLLSTVITSDRQHFLSNVGALPSGGNVVVNFSLFVNNVNTGKKKEFFS